MSWFDGGKEGNCNTEKVITHTAQAGRLPAGGGPECSKERCICLLVCQVFHFLSTYGDIGFTFGTGKTEGENSPTGHGAQTAPFAEAEPPDAGVLRAGPAECLHPGNIDIRPENRIPDGRHGQSADISGRTAGRLKNRRPPARPVDSGPLSLSVGAEHRGPALRAPSATAP